MSETLLEQLEEERQKVSRLEKLDSMTGSLQGQREALQAKCRELKKAFDKEQEDVERLNRTSFTSLLHAVMGDKEERLDQEQREALAARVKYEEAQMQLDDIESRLESYQREKESLRGSRQRYEALLEKRRESLKSAGDETARLIRSLEEEEAGLKSRLKEIHEAQDAGGELCSELGRVFESLDSASSWGTWDMLGGGMVTTMIKHSRIGDANQGLTRVQNLISRFRAELADVEIGSDLHVEIGSFMTFADFAFDNLWTDWLVQNKIEESKDQVRTVKSRADTVMNRLAQMKREAEDQLERVKERLRDAVSQA